MAVPSRVRFGVFDFDAASRELRRDGVVVRVQPQPAAVLGILVSRAGEIVTREEIRQAVWGSDTFVDFDRGLNFCIAQIRAALGDSADTPRFIRTLPKRGYQFIAPVQPIPSAADHAGEAPVAAPSQAASAPQPPRGRIGTAIALVIIFAVAAGALVSWIRRPPPPPRTPVVAVALFDVDDAAPETARFAQGLTDAVIAELTTKGDGRYGVIGNASILRRARKLRDLNAISEALNVRYVVLGSVQRDGNRMRVFAPDGDASRSRRRRPARRPVGARRGDRHQVLGAGRS
jgi:DNA-binding winged helix-turn-helix (wHTH) protein/TolB-like protein